MEKKIKYNKEDLKHTQSYGMADQMTIKKSMKLHKTIERKNVNIVRKSSVPGIHF